PPESPLALLLFILAIIWRNVRSNREMLQQQHQLVPRWRRPTTRSGRCEERGDVAGVSADDILSDEDEQENDQEGKFERFGLFRSIKPSYCYSDLCTGGSKIRSPSEHSIVGFVFACLVAWVRR